MKQTSNYKRFLVKLHRILTQLVSKYSNTVAVGMKQLRYFVEMGKIQCLRQFD